MTIASCPGAPAGGPAAACRLTTVLGDVERPAGGRLDAHAHAWIAPSAGVEGVPIKTDVTAVERDLVRFRAAGGWGIVDAQPPGAGRDLARLVELSQRSAVHVVASTGFHLRRYYAPALPPWLRDADAAHRRFVAEVRHGTDIDGVGVRAGAIKAAHPGCVDAWTARLLAAAAAASQATGALLCVHTERGTGLDELVAFLTRHGQPPSRTMLCHVDKRPDHGLHAELARAGFLLEYDTFARDRYAPDDNVWPLLARLIDDGHAASVACATDHVDVAERAGIAGLAREVAPRLLAAGVETEIVDAVTGGNVARRLALGGARGVA
jgi:5-phospho-D-xylono-1,4-lactonase